MTRSLALLLSLGLFACGPAGDEEGGAEPAPTAGDEAPREEPSPPPEDLPPEYAAVLAAHDAARAEHCAPPLAWSEELAGVARSWADELSSRGCPLEHSPGHEHGENLFMATAGTSDPAGVVGVWVGERDAYDFGRGGFSMETGHFTQVVWVGTTQLGCAAIECEGMDLWVCNYAPPGNIEGEYRENVLPTSCR